MSPRKRAPSKKKAEADEAAAEAAKEAEAEDASSDSELEEEEEDPSDDGGDDDSEDEKPKGRKRAPAKKGKAPPKRGKKAAAKKGSDSEGSEDDEGSESDGGGGGGDDDASEDEKPAPKKRARKAEPKPRGKKAAAADDEEEGAGAAGKLSAGDDLPAFELETEAGEKVSSAGVLEESGLVIFAYPKCNTAGCTKQACGFKDNHDALVAAGFKVFGISADNPKPQANWKSKHGLPYSLLCDPSKATLKALGILQGGKIVRSHIVVAKGGKVVDVRYGVAPTESPKAALESAQ